MYGELINMSFSSPLESFKNKLIEVVEANHSKLILASIGKQSKGKSYFLGHFLSDLDIPNKHEKIISRGTIEFFSRLYNDLGFLLLDMEGFESEETECKRDAFSFCTIFAIADIILMNINHDDLENKIFIDSFSLNYWRFCQSAIKLRKRKPIIMLAIRDPRWDDEPSKVIDAYNKLVEDFTIKINQRISQITYDFLLVFEDLLKRDCGMNESFRIIDFMIKSIKNDMREYNFLVDYHFIVFFAKAFGTPGIYSELVRNDDMSVVFKENSKFEKVLGYIKQKCDEIRSSEIMAFNDVNINVIESEETLRINHMINKEKERNFSKANIIKEIYVEALFNVIMHFSNKEGLIRCMEAYYRIYISVEKINNIIIQKLSTDIIELNKKQELTNLHKKEVEKVMKNAQLDDEIKQEIYRYLVFLSAKCFCETFKLNKENSERPLFQTLIYAIKFNKCQTILHHQIKEISKRKLMFQYLYYYDESFENIVKHLYAKKVYLFESIYCIYEDILHKSYNFDYKYQEVVDAEIYHLKKQKGLEYILMMLENLWPKPQYSFKEIKKFWKILTSHHIKMLQLKKQTLSTYKSVGQNMVIEIKEKCDCITSLGILEKILPSISGIIIGFASLTTKSFIKEAIESVVEIISATTESVSWIPIVGWTIFGATTVGSIPCITYSMFKDTNFKQLKYKKTAKPGYSIYDVLEIIDFNNAKIETNTNKLSKDRKVYEKSIVFQHEKANTLSVCMEVKFYIIHKSDNIN